MCRRRRERDPMKWSAFAGAVATVGPAVAAALGSDKRRYGSTRRAGS